MNNNAEKLKFCTIRSYANYESYVKHQGAKLQTIKKDWLEAHNTSFGKYLYERLAGLEVVGKGDSVLCLGARLGTEVEVFNKFGCLSIGIDIEPGKDNGYVLYGDFHNTLFSPGVFDILYTNSLDHSFDLSAVINESKRVLKGEGHFILDASLGTDEGGRAGEYESVQWDSLDNLSEFVIEFGFNLVSRKKFDYPWKGEQLCLQKC